MYFYTSLVYGNFSITERESFSPVFDNVGLDISNKSGSKLHPLYTHFLTRKNSLNNIPPYTGGAYVKLGGDRPPLETGVWVWSPPLRPTEIWKNYEINA